MSSYENELDGKLAERDALIGTLKKWREDDGAQYREMCNELASHQAQLQAACVELREKAADTARKCVHWYEGHGDAVGDCAADEILVIPIPTAALETAIAEARLDEHYCPLCGVLGTDNCARHIELQAAFDAAKAKESK